MKTNSDLHQVLHDLIGQYGKESVLGALSNIEETASLQRPASDSVQCSKSQQNQLRRVAVSKGRSVAPKKIVRVRGTKVRKKNEFIESLLDAFSFGSFLETKEKVIRFVRRNSDREYDTHDRWDAYDAVRRILDSMTLAQLKNLCSETQKAQRSDLKIISDAILNKSHKR